MRISDVLRRSGRNLRQAKARTILTALAIAVGAFTLTLTLAATKGAKSYVNDVISDNFDPAELIVARDQAVFDGANTSPQEYNENFGEGVSQAGAAIQVKYLTAQDIDELRHIEGVENVRLNIVLNLKYISGDNQKKYVSTMQVFSPASKPKLLAGRAPLQEGDLLLPEPFVESLGFVDAMEAVGNTIVVAVRVPNLQQPGTFTTLERPFVISGVTQKANSSQQPGTELYVYALEENVKNLQELSTQGQTDYQKYQAVFVRAKNGQDEKELQDTQKNIKDKDYAVQSVAETQEQLTSILNILQGIVLAFGLIAIIASVFGVINTMYISVLQRYREIGLMKALGMRNRDVSRLFRFEAAWIGFLGGSAGSLLAVLLGLLLNPTITTALDLGAGKTLLQFDATQIILLIVALVIVAVLAGLFPARKAAKLDPIEALRTE